MQVTSCCHCLSLRTGTIIIGTLQIIGLLTILILTFALNIQWHMFLIEVNPVSANIIYAIFFCILIFIVILLLVGVFKRNCVFMLPWLVLGVIGALFELVNIIIAATILFVNQVATQGIAFLVCALTVLAIYTYLWLVVYSYFQQLRSDRMNSKSGLHEMRRN